MLDPMLAAAAEARRRDLPASIALAILTGGVGAAILRDASAVGWAAIVTALLLLDAELYRRLDQGEMVVRGRVLASLAGWAGLSSAFYIALPVALWLNGQPAGGAAAMLLWVACAVRFFGAGGSGSPMVALAGAVPPALALLASPLLSAALGRPDWDLGVIAVIGGGALMAYVAQARLAPAREAREQTTALMLELHARNNAYIQALAALGATQEAGNGVMPVVPVGSEKLMLKFAKTA
jgi:hypothetical protein